MDKPTHKQVQQILANELGITREAIQEMVNARVDALMKKVLAEPGMEIVIERAAIATLNKMIRNKTDFYDRDGIREIVTKEAEKLVVSMKP